jgi:hypothetical protein
MNPKQIRFANIVKASGRPHPATLWVDDPDKDPAFKKAIEENRILTLNQDNAGAKADSGVIGFHKGPTATYLIFPKALAMAEGTRVIGLKFDLLDEAPVTDPVQITEPPPRKKIEHVKTVEPEPDPKPEPEPEPPKAHKAKKEKPPAEKTPIFKVTVQFTATVKRDIEVEAKSASAAIALALKQAEKLTPENPSWETEALEVKKEK